MTDRYRFEHKEHKFSKSLRVYVGSRVFFLKMEDLKNDGTAYITLGPVQKMLAVLQKKFGDDISIYRITEDRKVETLETD